MPLAIAPTTDIATCRALRRTVFIEEQGVAEADEIDDLDDSSIHLLANLDGVAIGTARLRILDGLGKIGRVCVLPEHRGTGLGTALMQAAIDELRHHPGAKKLRLSSQVHAIAFYEGLGFTAHGPEYDDAGIPHRDMDLVL